MKQRIDLTNWYEVIDYVASTSQNKKEKIKDLVFDLRKNMMKKIEHLSDMEKLNNVDENDGEWDDELNNEYKEYFSFKNIFYENAIVDKEDNFLTRYELRKKYGQDWIEQNLYANLLGYKRNLSINQLESLTSLLKKEYYDFWSYEMDKEDSISPKYHQYSISEYSKYIDDKNMFENFEVEVNQQKSKHIMKM